MKNTKITKIALLILSAALLLGTVIGFTVGAEAPEYEIIAKNVIYGDQIKVVFAVDATVEAANAGEVKVAYKWSEDGEVKSAVLLDTTDSDNLYNGHPSFAIEGVPAKELADVVYATAYTGDAPADDAKWITYSAAEYFYSRLYKNGFVNKTAADGVDYNRKLMYEAQIQLSANAQVVLNYNADKPVDKYSYVYTTSELVNFNGASAVFGYGELQANATVVGEGTLVGWTLTAVDGTETALETVILTATGIYKAMPVFGVHECVDVDKDHVCESCGEVIDSCKDADENGVCDYCHTYRFGEGVVYNNAGFSTIIKDNKGDWVGGTAAYDEYLAAGTQAISSKDMLLQNGVYMDVVNDPYNTSVENRVLRVATRMVGSKTSYIDVKVEKMSDTADVLEFTFDYMADFQNYKSGNFNMAYVQLWNTAAGKPASDTAGVNRDQNRQFILRSEMASANDTAKFALDTNTMKTSKVEGAFSFSANDGNTEAIIDSHTWYKVKLIVADGVMYRYYSADGGNTWNLISQSSGTDGHYIYPSDLDNASIVINTFNNTCRLYFDNISFVAVDEPSIELPTK